MLNRYCLESYPLSTEAGKPKFYIGVNHTISVTDDGRGIADELVKKFKDKHFNAEKVDHISEDSDVVILLDGLKNITTLDEAIKANFIVFRHTLNIAKRFSKKGGALISVQNTGAHFGLTSLNQHQAWSAGTTGLIKTAAIEWPKAVCRAIDLETISTDPKKIADQLFDEMMQHGSPVECGIEENGKRIGLRLTKSSCETSRCVLPDNAVILVSGGAKGITASCLAELAGQVKARFILLGRTAYTPIEAIYRNKSENELRQLFFSESKNTNIPITPKELNQKISNIKAREEIETTLATLKQAGSEAFYFSVDIKKYADVEKCVLEINKKFGRIDAIIHAAGVIIDKLIVEQSEELFSQVFETKVLGLYHLLRAVENIPLHLIALFSSVAGRFGNQGQVAYAMGNEVLNKVAQYEFQRRKGKCVVKSFNWGPWEMGMVTPELKKQFAERGIVLLPEKKGTAMFVDELMSNNNHQIEIICGGTLESSVEQNWKISLEKYPFLSSHVINNENVVPICFVLNYFLEHSDQSALACENLKLLNGVLLNKNDHEETLTFSMQENNFILKNKMGRTCYTAEMSTNTIINEKWQTNWPASKNGWKFEEPLYSNQKNKGILFHGPAFHVIDKLDTISETGGAAWLKASASQDWKNISSVIDVSLIDGVLQLLLLWGFYHNKNKSLPTNIGHFVQLTTDKVLTPVRCVFHCHTIQAHRFIADAVLLQGNDKPYAYLSNIEMCRANI